MEKYQGGAGTERGKEKCDQGFIVVSAGRTEESG
jgi:hypothetical protein